MVTLTVVTLACILSFVYRPEINIQMHVVKNA